MRTEVCALFCFPAAALDERREFYPALPMQLPETKKLHTHRYIHIIISIITLASYTSEIITLHIMFYLKGHLFYNLTKSMENILKLHRIKIFPVICFNVCRCYKSFLCMQIHVLRIIADRKWSIEIVVRPPILFIKRF